MFAPLSHTADAGLRLEAPTLDALFQEAAAGFLWLAVAAPATVLPLQRRNVALTARSHADLLLDWFEALIGLATVDRWLCARADVRVDGLTLAAALHGETLDAARHGLRAEIKAATYHGLHVTQARDGSWSATVIFDV